MPSRVLGKHSSPTLGINYVFRLLVFFLLEVTFWTFSITVFHWFCFSFPPVTSLINSVVVLNWSYVYCCIIPVMLAWDQSLFALHWPVCSPCALACRVTLQCSAYVSIYCSSDNKATLFLLETYMCVAVATNEATSCLDAGELFHCWGEKNTKCTSAEFFCLLF